MGTVTVTRVAREGDLDALTDVWERSARSSHGFMDVGELEAMRPFMRDSYLPSMEILLVESDGEPVAFVGAHGTHVELLYVDPAFHGQGLGSTLLSAIGPHGATSVEVYADNVTGLRFYRSKGFREVRRHDRDPARRPYAMIVMQR